MQGNLKLKYPITKISRLTERMLAQGYSTDQVSDGLPEGILCLDGINFEYNHEWKYAPTFESPCGLLVKGWGGFWGDTWIGGEFHCAENDNPLFMCPYRYRKCEHRKEGWPIGINCQFHPTEKECDGSYDQAVEDLQHKRYEAYQKFMRDSRGDGMCHCEEYKELETGETKYFYRYNVENCIQFKCTNKYCAARQGAERDLTKVNIFYDVLQTKEWEEGLLTRTEKKAMKGMKVFDSPIAKTDAEILMRMWNCGKLDSTSRLAKRLNVLNNIDRRESFTAKYFSRRGVWSKKNFTLSAEVSNIRIERFEQRDIFKDLEDVQNGIEVVHASDLQKAKDQKKHEGRVRSQAEKMAKQMIHARENGRIFYDFGAGKKRSKTEEEVWEMAKVLTEKHFAKLEEQQEKERKKQEKKAAQIGIDDLF